MAPDHLRLLDKPQASVLAAALDRRDGAQVLVDGPQIAIGHLPVDRPGHDLQDKVPGGAARIAQHPQKLAIATVAGDAVPLGPVPPFEGAGPGRAGPPARQFTVTVAVSLAWAPELSVTVNRTGYAPGKRKVCQGAAPSAVPSVFGTIVVSFLRIPGRVS